MDDDDIEMPDFSDALPLPSMSVTRQWLWRFEPRLVQPYPYRTGDIISKVQVRIERDPDFNSDYLAYSAYGVAAREDGKPDRRAKHDWYRYPGIEFFQPYIEQARALWIDIEGEFRDEPEVKDA